jgi:hypothetical protein
MLVDKDGIFWLCSTDGLVRYDEKIKKNYDAPFKVLLRHVSAGREILNPETGLGKTEGPDINYKRNTLRFERNIKPGLKVLILPGPIGTITHIKSTQTSQRENINFT